MPLTRRSTPVSIDRYEGGEVPRWLENNIGAGKSFNKNMVVIETALNDCALEDAVAAAIQNIEENISGVSGGNLLEYIKKASTDTDPAGVADIDIQAGAVHEHHIDPVVQSNDAIPVYSGGIPGSLIRNNTLGDAHFLDDELSGTKIAAGSLPANRLLNAENQSELVNGETVWHSVSGITGSQLQLYTVTENNLAPDAATTKVIKDAAVTTPKIASGAVNRDKVIVYTPAAAAQGTYGQPGYVPAVEDNSLACLTGAHFAPNSVAGSKLTTGTVGYEALGKTNNANTFDPAMIMNPMVKYGIYTGPGNLNVQKLYWTDINEFSLLGFKPTVNCILIVDCCVRIFDVASTSPCSFFIRDSDQTTGSGSTTRPPTGALCPANSGHVVYNTGGANVTFSGQFRWIIGASGTPLTAGSTYNFRVTAYNPNEGFYILPGNPTNVTYTVVPIPTA